ncbi:arylsulfotransferase family protein [Halobacteriales archaeon Cl-PHB]
MDRRRTVRLVAGIVLLVVVAVLVQGMMTAPRTASAASVPEAPPTENVTVVSESAKYGTLIAWNPDGSLLYYEDEHTKYYDVDPVKGTRYTVEYAATDTIHTKGPTCSEPPCTRNVVERANLSTGAVEVVYERYDPEEHAGEWHDHVRVNDTHLLVADMVHDEVFMTDTETGTITWEWEAQSDFNVTGGGPYPTDWTHLNDVSLLEDGRVMVSLRNFDQVVFVEPGEGVQDNWTLGTDGDHETLYEQHNPDYIPEARGGPAVLVADSENGRIVEYQRENESWERTWTWSDDRVQWPRDADRLPNGHTLISDTNGKRILEVDQDGEIVWEVPLSHPYEVERLGTGDESETGASAASLGLAARSGGGSGGAGGIEIGVTQAIWRLVESIFPPWVVNGVIYVAPVWMGKPQFVAVAVGLVTLLAWAGAEVWWRLPPMHLRTPVVRADDATERLADGDGREPVEGDTDRDAGDDRAE